MFDSRPRGDAGDTAVQSCASAVDTNSCAAEGMVAALSVASSLPSVSGSTLTRRRTSDLMDMRRCRKQRNR